MKWFLLCAYICFYNCAYSQLLKGTITDKNNKPIFAANIYLKSTPQHGTVTNIFGIFNLKIDNQLKDTLIISSIGFISKVISLESINYNNILHIVLNEDIKIISEITITARDPISKTFSVNKLDKLQIYLNPISQGDPLKAITLLPASTSTNETANPSLRGSSSDRSRVLLNEVPVYNPVRSSQINNQGFFSLFHPEIIEQQYVYSSNPPLIYGNSSAGLVDISTIKKLYSNQLQISVGLLNIGAFLSQRVNNKDKSFIQCYGNYQFSDIYVPIQKANLPNTSDFNTKDIGLNFHTMLNKRFELNMYNYLLDENYTGINNSYTYQGSINSNSSRIFTINNLKYITNNGFISFNIGFDRSKQYYKFGNIVSKNKKDQLFVSLNYKVSLVKELNLQFGISQEYSQNSFKDSIPIYYYAIRPQDPNHHFNITISNKFAETYAYIKWNINNKLDLYSGIRGGLPEDSEKFYLNMQFGAGYYLNREHHIIFNIGSYHSYSIPNYYSKHYDLLSSQQFAIDYSITLNEGVIETAIYYKKENGRQVIDNFLSTNRSSVFGVEFLLKKEIYNDYNIVVSNSFINQGIIIENEKCRGNMDLNYFIKASLQYLNPEIFTCAITYIGRPGSYYNPIISGSYNSIIDSYEPKFNEKFYTGQYKNYDRFDINFSKYIAIGNNSMITFITINNLFNNKNEATTIYNQNYSKHSYDYYSYRIFYCGVVFHLNY